MTDLDTDEAWDAWFAPARTAERATVRERVRRFSLLAAAWLWWPVADRFRR